MPLIKFVPGAFIYGPSGKFSLCGDLTIKLTEFVYNGLRDFKNIIWSLSSTTSTDSSIV